MKPYVNDPKKLTGTDCHDFLKFYDWAYSNGYVEGLTLDRIDNDGDYCPETCRWADSKTQSLNKTTNRVITFNNESKTLHEWALNLGISDQSLSKRIANGWNLEKALRLPSQKGNQYINNR